ncbi:MAG: radical SAM protein [Phycisphaerales bacterium]|nr:MAG: radical SAM protein [Phycisphaerales bacterium]
MQKPCQIKYKRTKRRVITRRGVLWLGQTCNLRCQFCYFLDRINSSEHPEQAFMPLGKARIICSSLVQHYNNCAVDIQGGEPTIYPDIHALIAHCREIGLLPSLITNGVILEDKTQCSTLKAAGVRDVLLSINGLGDTGDMIAGVPGCSRKQLVALDNLTELSVPVRFNCVLSKPVLPQLVELAELAVARGVRIVNFIALNLFEDQRRARQCSETLPTFSTVTPYLHDALDVLAGNDIEHNVRYYPLCMLKPGYRHAAYNFQQLPYDIHEWDYASMAWTGLTEQRMAHGPVSGVVSLRKVTPPTGPLSVTPFIALRHAVARTLRPHPRAYAVATRLDRIFNDIHTHSARWFSDGNATVETVYKAHGRLRASRSRYVYTKACRQCAVRDICDGFHSDYLGLFGSDEATPILGNQAITDPKHYINDQVKYVEKEDWHWAM